MLDNTVLFTSKASLHLPLPARVLSLVVSHTLMATLTPSPMLPTLVVPLSLVQ